MENVARGSLPSVGTSYPNHTGLFAHRISNPRNRFSISKGDRNQSASDSSFKRISGHLRIHAPSPPSRATASRTIGVPKVNRAVLESASSGAASCPRTKLIPSSSAAAHMVA